MTTREEIIAAAKEAGALLYGRGQRGSLVANGDALERFANIMFEAGRKAENEICEGICTRFGDREMSAFECSAAIRKRRKEK